MSARQPLLAGASDAEGHQAFVTLARCHLVTPAIGGVVSVALSLGSLPVAVNHHRALSSPDFPPLTRRRGLRPSLQRSEPREARGGVSRATARPTLPSASIPHPAYRAPNYHHARGQAVLDQRALAWQWNCRPVPPGPTTTGSIGDWHRDYEILPELQ